MTARIVVLTALAALAGAQLVATTALAQNSEIRDLDGFDAIEVGGSIDLTVRQGRNFSVEVIAEDGNLDDLITEVRGNTLRIHSRALQRGLFNFWQYGDYSVEVTLPALTELRSSGGADVRSDGEISGDSLTIETSGGSDVMLEVDVDRLSLQSSGGSDLTVRGRSDSLEARSSGGSDLRATDLRTRQADLHSSGGSDLYIGEVESIFARASGGSDIVYSGSPTETDVSSSGGGDITRRR